MAFPLEFVQYTTQAAEGATSVSDFTTWPPVLQFFAALGAAVAGGAAWWAGRRSKTSPEDVSVAQLQMKVSLAEVRDDLIKILGAMRVSFEGEMRDVRERLIRLEERVVNNRDESRHR